MSSREARDWLNTKVPLIKAFTGTHVPQMQGVTNAWTTRGLRTFNSADFQVHPGSVGLEEVGSPIASRVEKLNDEEQFPISNPEHFLLSSFLRSVDLYDSNGNKVVLTTYTDPNEIKQIRVNALESRKETETSRTALLFDASDQRIGMTADIIRVARSLGLTRDQFPEQPEFWYYDSLTSSLDYSQKLATLFFILIRDKCFEDVSGHPVEIAALRFLHEDKIIPAINNASNEPIDKAVARILHTVGFVSFDEENLPIKVQFHDFNMFRTSAGSLQKNLTPWTFGCDARCLFCYTDFGLGAVRYPGRWDRPMDEIELYTDMYDPETRTGLPAPIFSMQDWEPMTPDHFLNILEAIRTHAPEEPIFLVTHGGLLTEALAQELSKISNITLQISLNSSDLEMRNRVMRPQNAQVGIDSLALCKKYGINFDVSIVATPQWTGADDIVDTIRFADAAGADYIRLALPTATKDHHQDLLLTDNQLQAIDLLAKSMRDDVETPILVTVALLFEHGLAPKVEGVMKGSVAHAAGIRHNDVILSVNGIQPRSRTECNQLLIAARLEGCVILEIDRNGKMFESLIDLNSGNTDSRVSVGVLGRGRKELGPLGILIPDDVDFTVFSRMKRISDKHGYQRPIMLTSPIMEPFFTEALSRCRPEEQVQGLQISIVNNIHFGGNVVIAGLQTVDDQINTIRGYLDAGNELPDCIFVSAHAYSDSGLDVTSKSVKAIENEFGVPVHILKAQTGSY